ncbi:MAG: capsular polysaccharide biosynthesis protein [Planctomycetota bacterium]|jgi:capsular polysaccharide biosynthesis protein
MTQVEMPQLSLRRYIDLVKRRRWRVVPVSILGLLIGGLIAFFIPRFYVAQTTLLHSQLPGSTDAVEHPFKQIVDTAKSAIPLFVEEAISELKWPEYTSADEVMQQQIARDVESRIRIVEQNGGDRQRAYATLKVEYRDTNGRRSEQLLNKLVEVWMDRRTIELREPALARSQEAKLQAARALETVRQCRDDQQKLQQQYGIEPMFLIELQQTEYHNKTDRQEVVKKELSKEKSAHAKLAAEINGDVDKLADTPPRVKPVDALWFDEAMKDEKIAPLAIGALRQLMAFTSTFNPGTPAWYSAKREYAFLVAQAKQMLSKEPVGADGMVPNPDYTELQLKIVEANKELTKLAAGIDSTEKQLERDAAQLERLKEGYPLYMDKLQELDEAKKIREDALAAEVRANEVNAKLTHDLPVKQIRPAVMPEAPTEPNIMIVASAGCVLGLLAAIALILLFDFLQGSYKTIEDVERGLTVPVLGGVSYLETEVERQVASRSRRRISLVAAAALLMVTAIVTVFYLDPNRLPEVVRNILNVLLVDS